MQVERAKSGRAKCARGCGELIAKNEIRVGMPLKDQRGCNSLVNTWTHVACTMIKETVAKHGVIRANHCYGIDAVGKSRPRVFARGARALADPSRFPLLVGHTREKRHVD